jgi:hypothetical protein
MPASRRDSFFLEPSREDVARIESMLKDARTVLDVEDKLGKADIIHEFGTSLDDVTGALRAPAIRKALMYPNCAQTCGVAVNEYSNGMIFWTILRKQTRAATP